MKAIDNDSEPTTKPWQSLTQQWDIEALGAHLLRQHARERDRQAARPAARRESAGRTVRAVGPDTRDTPLLDRDTPVWSGRHLKRFAAGRGLGAATSAASHVEITAVAPPRLPEAFARALALPLRPGPSLLPRGWLRFGLPVLCGLSLLLASLYVQSGPWEVQRASRSGCAEPPSSATGREPVGLAAALTPAAAAEPEVRAAPDPLAALEARDAAPVARASQPAPKQAATAADVPSDQVEQQPGSLAGRAAGASAAASSIPAPGQQATPRGDARRAVNLAARPTPPLAAGSGSRALRRTGAHPGLRSAVDSLFAGHTRAALDAYLAAAKSGLATPELELAVHLLAGEIAACEEAATCAAH